jgi:hypothetical protein
VFDSATRAIREQSQDAPRCEMIKDTSDGPSALGIEAMAKRGWADVILVSTCSTLAEVWL